MAQKSFNWLVNRIIENELKDACEKYFNGVLLDIGCGNKPYKELLKPYIDKHIGLDHDLTDHDLVNADIIGTAYSIPLGNNQVDSIICTYVLEHLEEPQKAILEGFRVLKHDGHAVYFVPFIWHLHEEPRDFFRYTKYGLRYLFEKAGYFIVEIKPLSGFIVTFTQLLIYYMLRFNRGIIKNLRLFDIVFFVVQRLAYFLNKYDKSFGWSWSYKIVVKKV